MSDCTQPFPSLANHSAPWQHREIPAQYGWGRVTAGAGAPAVENVGTASDGPIRQDRAGAVSGLNLDPPAAAGSGTIQAEVAASRAGDVEIGLVEQVIPERFQPALRDFLERAPESQDALLAMLFRQGRPNGGCLNPSQRGATPTSRESGGHIPPWARSGCRATGPASRAVAGRSGGRF